MDFFSIDHLQALADRYLVPFAINLVIALLVFYIGRSIARLVVKALTRVMEKKLDQSLTKFCADLAYAVLMLIVIIAALDRLGVKTTAAIAVLGAAGLAIGLALQGSLGNFASGVMILLFKPFGVGDVVNVAGQVGKVDSIKVFSTVLTTGDNRTIIVPNGTITSGVIENLTVAGTRRVDMVFGIGYGDDIKKAKAILEEIVKADARVLPEPAPQIALSELADSSVNFVVRPWCKAEDYWGVLFDTTEKVKERFDAEGISIPFPQRDIHVHNVAA